MEYSRKWIKTNILMHFWWSLPLQFLQYIYAVNGTETVETVSEMEYNITKVNVQHKDRIFCDLFGDASNKEPILSLYNAVNGSSYTNAEDITVVTLSNAIYAQMHNDVAFIFEGQLNVYEEQSTVNPNMPFRGLLYFAAEYERLYWRNNPKIYGTTLMKIAAPRFVVFYLGLKDAPAFEQHRLSEAFEVPSPGYEWTADVINVNYGGNMEILEKCETLKGYSMLIAKIRSNVEEGLEMKDAVDHAVNDCIKEGILSDYLSKNKDHAIFSLLTEYDEEATIAYIRQESEEIGYAKGHNKGIEDGTLLAAVQAVISGMGSFDKVCKTFKVSPDDLRRALEKAKAES